MSNWKPGNSGSGVLHLHLNAALGWQGLRANTPPWSDLIGYEIEKLEDDDLFQPWCIFMKWNNSVPVWHGWSLDPEVAGYAGQPSMGSLLKLSGTTAVLLRTATIPRFKRDLFHPVQPAALSHVSIHFSCVLYTYTTSSSHHPSV